MLAALPARGQETAAQGTETAAGTASSGIETAAGTASSGTETAAGTLLEQARDAITVGDAATALELLRVLRDRFHSDPRVADALALSATASIATGDPTRARYFLERLAELYPGAAAGLEPAVALGDLSWNGGDWAAALAAYRIAGDAAVDSPERDHALVRAADIELNRLRDSSAARLHWQAARFANLAPVDLELHRRLRMRLAWKAISPAALGLADANVSALAVDGDDLWVGTWNGGTARWSLSSETAVAFPSPESPRAFQPTDRRVYVATFSGLAFYARGSGNWTAPADLAGSKVQAVTVAGGELYAGTLGEGLFRLNGERWERVGSDDWPGLFITCLAPEAGGRLLVGTMNLGLLTLDAATGAITGLADTIPEFTPLNITAVLADRDGRVWIGTYGEGLWLWEPSTGGLSRFGRDTGEIADDYVLSLCESDAGVWVGTFGGGASFRSFDGRWRRLGVADGLPSQDVSAIAWRAPWVYLGTMGAGVVAYWESADGP
jgi:hypothetical protein